MWSRSPAYAAGCRLPFAFPFPEGSADAVASPAGEKL